MAEDLLRIASFNMQAGIGTNRPRHMITHGWRYLLPHRHVLANLEQIAQALTTFDLVALQEADAGSFRTGYVHQQEYMALRAGFSYSQSLITREFSPIASISLGLMSRLQLDYVRKHKLPASRHGRGALESVLRWREQSIAVITAHLSLRKESRLRQVGYLVHLIQQHPFAIVTGDFNCGPGSQEFDMLVEKAGLHAGHHASPKSYPSWQPVRSIDHILTTKNLEVTSLRTIPILCSDHLPIAAEIRLG